MAVRVDVRPELHSLYVTAQDGLVLQSLAFHLPEAPSVTHGLMQLDSDLLWSAVPYPAILLDPADRILSCNGATELMFSTSLRQMQGAPLARFVSESSALIDSLRQTRRGVSSVVRYDLEVTWADRPARSFTLHAARVQDGGGNLLVLLHPTGLAAQMDRTLSNRSAARSVTGMAAMLAHEIRNRRDVLRYLRR